MGGWARRGCLRWAGTQQLLGAEKCEGWDSAASGPRIQTG